MKTIFYFAFLMVALSFRGYSEEKENGGAQESGVSYFVENNFVSRYQSATNVKWTVCNQFQKASFVLDGVKMEAFYDNSGNYIATSQYVDSSRLPAISRVRLEKEFKNYQVDEVVRYDLDGTSQHESGTFASPRNYNTLYFASLKNNNEKMILKITPDGEMAFLKNM